MSLMFILKPFAMIMSPGRWPASQAPSHLAAIERLVDLDLAEQKLSAAMSRIQEQIDRDPKLALAWAMRGKIYLAQRDFTHAETDLLKAIELDPNLEPAYILLAQLYVASNRTEQAIEKLNGFIEKRQTVPTLMLLAGIQERTKNFAAARDAYEKVLGLSANYSPALNNLAVLYSEQLGQLDKAYDLAKKAKEANPNEPHLADTLGWILFKRGEYADALRMLQESAAKLPANPEIQFHLGSAHYMLGQDEPALVALKKATDASADFSGKGDARRRLAMLSIDASATTPAVRTELQNYLREQPDDPVALAKFAEIQARDGALEEAIKTYEKILSGNPLFAPAMRRLANLYGQRSVDDPKAYDVAQKAYQAYPQDPEVARALGILSYRREHYPRAAELLRQAALKRTDDAEILYYLGAAHHQLKQWNECKTALERALGLNLAPALADKAKPTLAECSESASP